MGNQHFPLQKEKFLLIPLLGVMLALPFAEAIQAQDLIWAKQAGGISLDLGSNIAVDASGNCYVIGVFEGSATFGTGDNETTLTSIGPHDIFITEYSNAGSLLWAKQIETNTEFEAWSDIAVDASGAIYITSPFQDTATFGNSETTLTSAGSQDLFVAKYNTEGMFLWAKQASGEDMDRGTEIDVDNSGNSYISGFFTETATFGSGETNEITLTSAGASDILIAKYDVAGMFMWAKVAGGLGFDSGKGIAVDTSGNSHVMGSFVGTATFGLGETNETTLSTDSFATFLAKYDTEGMLLWVTQSNGSGSRVALDASGNSYVAGSFGGSATFGSGEANEITLTVAGANDIFITKYDVAGLLIWARRAGGSGYDMGNSLAIDASGNCYVTGTFQGSATFGMGETNQTVLNSTGNSDIFVAAYNKDGFLLRVKHAGGVRFDMGSGIAVGPSADIYVTGRFQESAIFGGGEPYETTLNSVGATDIFVAKYGAGSFTSVGETLIPIDDFKLAQNYPNPFNLVTIIFFESPKAGQVMLAIYNLRGQLVRTLVSGEAVPGRQHVIWNGTDNNGRNVASGIYIYKLNAGELSATKKMILLQ